MQARLRDMQVEAPPLLPLLRSRLQAEILTLILLSPDREWTVTELAYRVGRSLSSVMREVARAEQAGVVSSRKLGNTRLATAAKSPLTEPLTELLLRSFGPRLVIGDELSGIDGIESAYIFGSWAARYEGHAGRAPNDVDVLILGKPDRAEVDDAMQRSAARLAREVNATIRSVDWWESGTDGFHTEVTSRPIVAIVERTAK